MGMDDVKPGLSAELDVEVLSTGCRESQAQLEQLVQDNANLSELDTFRKVSEHIASFEGAIPLIASLKTDALRDRPWRQLMAPHS